MGRHNRWTEEEDAIIRRYYPSEGGQVLDRLPQRAKMHSLHRRASILGIRVTNPQGHIRWTPEEDALLRQHYYAKGSAGCAQLINRTRHSINRRASYLGIKAAPAIRTAGRFAPACNSHNKGTRRPRSVWTAKVRQHWFKPGNISPTTKPIGTISRFGTRVLIKVTDTPRAKCKNWKLLNRHIWEHHHGPIPPNHAVVLIQGDPADISAYHIDNLRLQDKAAHMRAAKAEYPAELRAAVHALTQLKRGINRKLKKTQPPQPQETSS